MGGERERRGLWEKRVGVMDRIGGVREKRKGEG